jgi:hypothetical protein
MPPLSERIKSYREELKKWEESGKPYRSKQEIERIFNTYCKECEFLTTQIGQTVCDICGCFINKSLTLNKIALGTTKCPKDKWDEELKQEKNIVAIKIEEQKTPLTGGANCCG